MSIESSKIQTSVDNKIENYQYKSYAAHSNTYKQTEVELEEEFQVYKDWFRNDTVDLWRHLRMFKHLDLLLKFYAESKWLSVSDGRWGTATRYLNSKGVKALATDIDVKLLKIAVEKKLIKEYKYENAENLSFKDNEFDFSYCKESFHHFPRAYIALYEMLRVSKVAIVITEPRDWLPSPIVRKLMQTVKNCFKKLLFIDLKHTDTGNYESIGNYIFTVSEREVEKIALGLHLPTIAFKNFQDVYLKGVEKEMVSQNGPLLKKIKIKILLNHLLQFFLIEKTNHITAIIFKVKPKEELKYLLKKNGFNVIDLPSNPY